MDYCLFFYSFALAKENPQAVDGKRGSPNQYINTYQHISTHIKHAIASQRAASQSITEDCLRYNAQQKTAQQKITQ